MATWKRQDRIQLSRSFHSKEFTCQCGICSVQMIDSLFLKKLQELRDAFGAPITISSGYRCELRQKQLRDSGYETATGISSHTQGIAADLVATDMARLLKAAEAHFNNIGVSGRFIHVDNRLGKRRWGYKT